MKMKHPLKGKREIWEQTAELLHLPMDVTASAIQMRIGGNRELLVSNHQKIITYLDTCICLAGKRQRVTICGSGLQIPYYSSEGIRIIGRIRSISIDTLYE